MAVDTQKLPVVPGYGILVAAAINVDNWPSADSNIKYLSMTILAWHAKTLPNNIYRKKTLVIMCLQMVTTLQCCNEILILIKIYHDYVT